jgi:hypothetical protein
MSVLNRFFIKKSNCASPVANELLMEPRRQMESMNQRRILDKGLSFHHLSIPLFRLC